MKNLSTIHFLSYFPVPSLYKTKTTTIEAKKNLAVNLSHKFLILQTKINQL